MFIRIYLFAIFCFVVFSTVTRAAVNFSNVDIPKEHMPFYFANFPGIAKQCIDDEECAFKVMYFGPIMVHENFSATNVTKPKKLLNCHSLFSLVVVCIIFELNVDPGTYQKEEMLGL